MNDMQSSVTIAMQSIDIALNDIGFQGFWSLTRYTSCPYEFTIFPTGSESITFDSISGFSEWIASHQIEVTQ